MNDYRYPPDMCMCEQCNPTPEGGSDVCIPENLPEDEQDNHQGGNTFSNWLEEE
jgi:hypothetical protein